MSRRAGVPIKVSIYLYIHLKKNSFQIDSSNVVSVQNANSTWYGEYHIKPSSFIMDKEYTSSILFVLVKNFFFFLWNNLQVRK